MCGITGFWELRPSLSPSELVQTCRQMADRIAHRGPDDQGVWTDCELGVALGHRRLAILDLSARGRQPMASGCGRYQISYNGEIYNYRELRRELESLAFPFQGGSDTEVLLAAIVQWGAEAALKRLEGMFAFALWDRKKQALFLARDRYGKKPLYYGLCGQAWVFGSELKAFHSFPSFQPRLDQQSVGLFFRFGHVPGPHSIYQGIKKLPPASCLWLTRDYSWPLVQSYWSVPEGQNQAHLATLDELEGALGKAVAERMVSDVPVGAFLSGGIDSSLVVALMQEQASRPVRTFCIGFAEDSHNEARYASAIARRLETEHTELIVSANQALAVVPQIPIIYDEPFADASQVPTFLVSRLARGSVTVALSGDGGDEVFGGYNRYIWAPRLWRFLRLVPVALRKLAASLIARLQLSALAPILKNRVAYPEDKLSKFLNLLDVETPRDLYRSLTCLWPTKAFGGDSLLERLPMQRSFVTDMMVLDAMTYLPDDILVKVDRASMAVGLEVRAPLLDARVTEVAWRLPLNDKIHRGRGKLALRRLLSKRLSVDLFERPKAGFSMPVGAWLRSELRDWANDLLGRLRCDEYLDGNVVARRWSEHLAGARDWGTSLWVLLMFQAWREHWLAKPAGE